MGGMNILLPLAVCQDIVENQDHQHVYKASVSMGGKDGIKTIGSLQARVVFSNSSKADKMVEVDLSLPCSPVRYFLDKENLHCRIEDLEKVSQAPTICSGDENHSQRENNSQDGDETESRRTKQAEQAFDQNTLETRAINQPSHYGETQSQNREKETFHKSLDQWVKIPKEENDGIISSEADLVSLSADHGYSLTVCESQHRDQLPKTSIFPRETQKTQKRSTNKYDELIRKLKQPIDTPKVAETLIAQKSFTSQNMPPKNSPSTCTLSADTYLALSGSGAEKPQTGNIRDGLDFKGKTGDKGDSTTDKAAPLDSSVSEQRRFVRKYDRLIKNLEMASERSGLEMLSVLSGHSYKLDHDTKREQKKADITADVSGKGGSTCGAKLVQKRDHGFGVSSESNVKNTQKMKGSVSNKSNSSKSTSSVNSQPPSPQTLSHVTSFPRKFPRSLTRTDLNVFVSNSKAGQSRKRRQASTGSSAETMLNICQKTDDMGKLYTTIDSETGRKNRHEQAESLMELSELSTAVCGGKKSKVLSDSLSEAVGLDSTTCVKQRGKPESIAVQAATEGNAPSPSVRGLSDFFYLPVDPSDNSEPNSKEQKLLVGPFQVLGDAATNTQGPVGDDTKRFSLLQSRRRTSASSSRGRNVLTGEAPRMDHDYTNLVYDKNAPSSRALKTLVKPISMTRHINARVERVEEGEGSSLVTISGLNRKAAGGSYPYTLRPVLGITKEGMPIVETLEDALADTIRCREKLHDISRKAIQAKPCPPILVDACDIPVLKEVVITPARSHQDLHCTFKPRTWTPRTKRKPPPPLQHQDPKTDDTSAISLMQSRPSSIQHQLTDPKTDGANAQNAISLLQRRPPTLHYQLTDPKPHEANAQKAISLVQRKGPTLQYQVTDPKIDEANVQNAVLQLTQRETENGAGTVTNAIVYTNEGKVVNMVGARLPQECLSAGLVSARLTTGEQTQVVSSVHSELDQDAFIHINNQTVMGETPSKCNQEITVNHTVINNENKPAEPHIVIDNEKEATATTQHLSTNVCHYCLKMFHSPTMLCKHVITVHAAYAIHPQYTHYLRTLKRDSQVVCPLCPHLSVLCNEYHLRTHLVSCHGRTKADLADSTAAAGLPSSVVCEVCQVHFLTVKELQAHARLMHNCDVISCPHCPLVFVRGDTRARHMAAVHGDNSGCPFVCRLCDAAFESKDDLRLHKQVHRRGSRLQDGGRNCVATTPRPRAHRSLWRTKTPGLHCQYCPDSEFTDVAHLVSHRQQVHPGPVPVHCLVCGTGFHSLRAMSSHLHTHLLADPTQDSASNLQCPLCPEKASPSAAPSQMLSHLLNNHQDRFPHSCTLCALRFVSEVPLHVHLKQAHQQDSAGSLSVSDGLTEGVSEVPLHVHLEQAHQQDSAGFAGSVSVSNGLTEGVSETVDLQQAHQHDVADFSGSLSASKATTEGVLEMPLHVHLKQAHQHDVADFSGSLSASKATTEGVLEMPLHVHLKQAHQHDVAGFSGSLSVSKATTEGVLEMPLHVHLKQAYQHDVSGFSGSLSASKATTEGVLEMPLDVHLKQAHQHDVAGFSGTLSASDAAVECVPETVHLKQSHQYVTGFSDSLSASETATEGKSVSNIIQEEGKSVSDIIQEQCPDPCSLVASASESTAGKTDAGSVLCCLPPEVQTQIQRIIQQGKQAVVTVGLQNRQEQKIVFTPALSHTAEEITQPASHPISLLEVANKTLISESSLSVGESNNGEAVTEDLPEHPTPVGESNRNEVATEELSQHTVAGLYYMSSTSGGEATTTMEEMASVDSHLVICDMSAAAGLADEHYEHEQNAHPICAQSVTMVNSGGVFLTSSQPEKAVVSVDGLGEFSSDYGSKEEEGMRETQRLAEEESMLEQVMQVEMERTSDVVNEETVMVIITETGDQFVVR